MHNILIFGDSIAAGRKVEKIRSWPLLLSQYIDREDKDFTLVHNLSIPGETTNEIVKRFPTEAEARCKRIYPNDHSSIIFAAGINDTKSVKVRDDSITNTEDFKNNIELLIENARKCTDHIIFVGLTPVDEGKTIPAGDAYFLNEQIKSYEKIIDRICKENKIGLLSIIDEWLTIDYIRLLSDDGIHPNEMGHQRIFEKIRPFFS
ncbi:MAG: SGNH/GDSL hydrolase family protein [Patescibacteria group bacterium]|nr:SGNH/GDSL hydrolase family protein [Patescibacteria group bacterium]